MLQGTVFNPPKSKVINAIGKRKGIVQLIAKDFDVAPVTMYRYLKKHNLMDLIYDERKSEEEDLLDAAQIGIKEFVYMKDDNTRRIDACKFVLTMKGQARGWGVSSKEHDERVVVQDKIADNIKVVYKEIE